MGDFLVVSSLTILMLLNRIVKIFFWNSFIMQNTTHVNECMRSYNVIMHDANVMMENVMRCYAYGACMHNTEI